MSHLPSARIAERRSERLIEELLAAQGWDTRRPPQGEVLTQQEYKDFPSLKEALAQASKIGRGPGVPEYVLVDRASGEPLAVFEAKAKVHDIERAVKDAKVYGDAFVQAGYAPLAVAVAGTRDETFELRVLKHHSNGWRSVTYEGDPIAWLPSRDQLLRVLRSSKVGELRPEVPPPEVLKARAEEINGLLRESGLKDDFRPAVIGAIMLSLWKSGGSLRRDSRFILADINQACGKAFSDANKQPLANSLRVDEANEKLAVRSLRIAQILERLNITTLTAEHDYLGALYEEFFRYTGGNTIGQYFTPRHITKLMAELCEIGQHDVVLDPACGTGGFLIAAMERMQAESRLPREQIVKTVETQLIGLEDEPVTAALCVANMILRGDGSTGVVRADCFDDSAFPFDAADVLLMNPPFPHKKTDVPPAAFVSRALLGVKRRGKAAIVVPSSLLVKPAQARWRREVLKDNTLLAVITLPTELFQPYASSTTSIVLVDRGVPHPAERRVFMCRIANDGFRLRKGVRVPRSGSQIDAVISNFRNLVDEPRFSKAAPLEEDAWAPGAYIDAQPLTDEEFREGVATLIRDKAAFVARYAPQLQDALDAVESGEVKPIEFKRKTVQPTVPAAVSGTAIGDFFDIYYGQQELESKNGLLPGKSLIISSTGADNGAYGFFEFSDLIRPPFVTVPRTGSIGEARVQEFPCAATSDCLLLIPKSGTPIELLYVAAATLRDEKWRFDYSRKITPGRVAIFPLRLDPGLLKWVRHELKGARALEDNVLEVLAGRARKGTS